jgi:hypothetical protein
MNCPHDRDLTLCPECYQRRELPCVICQRSVPYYEATNEDPECPAMVTAIVGGVGRCTYFGLVREADGSTTLIVTCSDACTARLITQ